jgi:mono/diheme cytochrome c family protein
MLTMNKWKVPGAEATIKTLAAGNKARGVQLVATTVLNPPSNTGRGPGRGAGPSYTAAEQGAIDRGGQIYRELCFACHGEDGFGAPRPGDTSGATLAPRLAGSPRVNGHRDYIIKAIMYGLTGPIDDRTYNDVMIPMGSNPDDWVAAVASYVRTSFGNSSGVVTAADVKRVRDANASRKTPWTASELEASLPAVLLPDRTWKLTASHNPSAASGAVTMMAWNSEAPQAPGMWFQIEMPQAETITEIRFDSTVPGGRGRGNARQGAPGQPPAAAPTPGYPRAYKVETSMDGTTWARAAEGQGSGATTIISFQPARAKFLRLTQTGSAADAPAWSIQQLRLFAPGKGTAR